MPMLAIRTLLGFDTTGFDTPSALNPSYFVPSLLNRRYGLLAFQNLKLIRMGGKVVKRLPFYPFTHSNKSHIYPSHGHLLRCSQLA